MSDFLKSLTDEDPLPSTAERKAIVLEQGVTPSKDWVIVTRGVKREYDMGGEVVRALRGDHRAAITQDEHFRERGMLRPGTRLERDRSPLPSDALSDASANSDPITHPLRGCEGGEHLTGEAHRSENDRRLRIRKAGLILGKRAQSFD